MPAYPCCNNFTFPGTCGLCSDALPATMTLDLTGTPITRSGVVCTVDQCNAYQSLFVCDPDEVVVTSPSLISAIYANYSPGVCNVDWFKVRIDCNPVSETYQISVLVRFTNDPLNVHAWSTSSVSYSGSPITCGDIDVTYNWNGGNSPSGGCGFDGEDIRVYATAA